MSCLSVKFTRVGGIESSATRVGGGISSSLGRIGGIRTSLERIGGISTTMERKGGITCRFFQECRTGIADRPYLEISPEIVWVLAGWTSNEVFSNTDWNID